MHSTIVAASLLAGSALALNPLAFPKMKRDLLEARQTDGGSGLGDLLPSGIDELSPSCTSALIGLFTSLPTPPAKLITASALADASDPCSVSVPNSLTSDYSSYSSELRGWYSENSDDISSAFSECSQLQSLTSLLPVCATDLLGGATGTDTASAQTTGSSTSTSSSSSSDSTGAADNTNGSGGSGGSATDSADGSEETDAGSAAVRQTGFAAAAIGVAALVAML